ncbi:MAG: C1 family peptidase [Desulfococcaceae bacterium]
MKKHLWLLSVLCLVLVMVGCKLTITAFTAPDTAETGELITLTVTGDAVDDGNSTTKYGIVLQIPDTWEVKYAASDIIFSGAITEDPVYASLYTPESGYKIWVGTNSQSGTSGRTVKATIKVLTGTFTGTVGTVKNYNLKAMAGVLRSGVWVNDDPSGIFNFASVTADKYVEPISITKVTDTNPPAAVTQLSATDAYTGSDVRVSWTYDESGQKDVLGYRVYQSTSYFTNVTGMTYTQKNFGTSYHDVSGLVKGTTYYFAVTAVDEVPNENKTVTPVAVTPQQKLGSLTGRAFENKCPSVCSEYNIQGASISARKQEYSFTNKTATSGTDGTYTITGLPIGTYSVTVSKTGYENESYTVQILENQTASVGDRPLIKTPAGSSLGLVGTWPYGSAKAVAKDDARNAIYLGVGGGIYVLNVSNPASPQKVAEIKTPGLVEGLFYLSNKLYVADGESGLRIIDVTNLSSPYEIGYFDTPGTANDVYVSGSYAYVADGYSGLRIVSVSNSASPMETGFFDTPGSAYGVFISGSYAYVADHTSGLRIINVSNPASPISTGFLDTPGYAWKVYISGSYAYLADNTSLRIINVSNPANPLETGSFNTSGNYYGVYVSGSYVYMADCFYGLRIINAIDPANPIEVGYYSGLGTNRVVVSGNYAYLSYNGGLNIINLSNPTNPIITGYYRTPGAANRIFISGSYAYLADGYGGLRIIDIGDPINPVETGFFITSDYVHDVYISGYYAFIANGNRGLRIVNVSNPYAPIEIGFYNTPGYALGISVSGSYAYVADGGSGLRIVNVSNPAAPVETGFYYTHENACGVSVYGSYAYVVDGNTGLRVVNVSNPGAPVETGFYDTPGYAGGIYVSGSYAYVADGNSGLRIINVNNPANPIETGYYDTSGYSESVYVSGDYAYVADGNSGLRIIGVGNPANPIETGYYDTLEMANGISVSGSYAYVADGSAGLSIFQIMQQPIIYTNAVSSVTQTTATSGGNVTLAGSTPVTARGVCWSTSQNPTIANSKTSNGTGTGTFTCSITGLSPNTTYYARAYAVNSVGISYGNQVSFTTLQSLSVPTVTTSAVSTITQTAAASGGNVISDGGASVTAKGVCWSTAQNPTISNSKTSNGTGTGSFTSSITGLSPGTTYYVRAYATNSKGTGYGTQVSFTTQSSYTISGYVRNFSTAYGISGVTLTLSNSGGTTVTDSSGYYTKTVNSGWSGTVTPSLAGYTFSPANRTYSSVATSYFNQDFSATPVTYTVSGYIRNASSAGISGVTVSFSNNAGSVLTDSSGYYSRTVSYGYSGTATPQKSGYTFSPISKTYTSVTANQASQNYTATPTSVPNISLSPQSLLFKKPNTGRSAERVEESATQSQSTENDESFLVDGEYGMGLVIPDEETEYWETHTPSREYRMRRSIPASLDWSGYDSPVRSQGRCGSCWAFTAVALVENMANRANLSIEKDFAEQVLISCILDGDGCNGGHYRIGLYHIRDNGIPPELCYQYTYTNGNCSEKCSTPDYTVKVKDVPFDSLWGETDFSPDDLKGALQDGPLCVGMNIYADFYYNNYKGGIYHYTYGNFVGRHAILLVGYNENERYFKAKNSWGSSWGESGYFRISYDDVTNQVNFGRNAVNASGIFVEGLSGQIQEITLSNTGTANLNVSSISSNKTWLSVSPASFSNILPGESRKISVTVTDWNAVISPEDSAIITVSSNDPDQPVITVEVIALEPMMSGLPVLSVFPPFYASTSTNDEKLTVNVGNSKGETFLDIINEGQDDMLWTVATSDSWLTIKSGSPGTNSGRVVISYSANTSGPRTGTVTVTSEGAENSPQTVYIYQSDIDEDKDDDGMPDWYEFVYGFDSSNPDDAFGDADEDGLTNLKEYQIGTNPGVDDSDGDGMKDGYEVLHGLDPLVYNTNLKDVMIGLQILAGIDINPAGSNADADKNGKTELKDVLINIRDVSGLQ